jgi:K+-sensing histidine kinase KdpD
MPHIFERFYRAPRRQGSPSEGGSGIGLAVVKGLAEAMGGSVLARPSALGGLEVVVRLQIDSEPELAVEAEPEVGGAAELAAESAVEPAGSSVPPEAR